MFVRWNFWRIKTMEKTYKVIAVATAMTVLAACGGGSSSSISSTGTTAAPVTIGGLAIDGYLANAKVCLDLNLNFKCDVNEPSSITDKDGAYSIKYTGGDAAGLVVITETTKDTKDSDDGGLTFEMASRSPFVLAAPVPVGATNDVKITPLTTVVTTNALTENTAGGRLVQADINAAETALKTTLGVDAGRDLLKLDVTKDASLSKVAQVISHTLGEIQKTVTDNSASKMKSAVLASANTVTGLLVEGAVPASVAAALAKPAAERAAALSQIAEVKSAITVTSKTVNLGGATVEAKQVLKDGFVIGNTDSGYNPIDTTKSENIGDYKLGKYLSVEYLKYDTDSKAYSVIKRIFDGAWVKAAEWSTEYSLSTKGTWINTQGAPLEKGLVTVNKNCIILAASADLGFSDQVCLEEKDLSNLVISELNAGYCGAVNGATPDQALCKAAKFTAGSKGYEGTFSTIGSDAYKIWVPNRSTERLYHYGSQNRLNNQPEASTISAYVDALVKLKGVPGYFVGIDAGFGVRLKDYDSTTKKGVFTWIYRGGDWKSPEENAGENSFEIKDVAGVAVLVLKPTLRYHQVRPGNMVGRDFIFVAKDNQIMNGEVSYIDVRKQLALNGFSWLGNKAMLESILSGLKFNGSLLPAFPFTAASDK